MGTRSADTSSWMKPKFLSAAAAIAVAAGAAGWAINATVVGQGETTQESEQNVWAKAEASAIGSSLNLSTIVKQPVQVVASNHLAGVVSSVSEGEKKPGDVIYSVAGSDVYVISGQTPLYQDIGPKASGENVKQVESFLKDQEYFSGTPDTRFDAATTSAIKGWQIATKQKADGRIALGRMVAISSLPGQVDIGEEIRPGKNLAGGEDAVLAPSGERTFTMSLTGEQAALIPQDSAIEVNHGDLTWEAQIAQTTTDESGNVIHTLAGPSGGSVCDKECDELPAGSNVTLRSKVIVVPETKGIGIPSSAVTTTASGETEVVTENGPVPVEVVASGQGIVIVEGLEEGTSVQVLAANSEAR
ncbi:peptidoglycan-binding protein [Glutamicibacter arilaitensis]|uniref:peptidoglycan-binding protein n=1 Tax=Glutamicibacter arilaitensis TaxID=256701 RepID=UPI003FD19390